MTVGQGSPHVCDISLPLVIRLRAQIELGIARLQLFFFYALLASLLLVGRFAVSQTASFTPAAAESLDAKNASGGASASERLEFELRMVWGGGTARAYNGSLSIENGTLQLVRNLSLQADSVGALSSTSSSTLKVAGHSASTFGGADIKIAGTPSSRLTIRFDHPATRQPIEHSFALSEVLHQRWFQNIDEQGGRVAAERLMQDRLRVKPVQEKSIFPAGTSWMGSIEGYRCGLPAGDYQLTTKLLDQSNGDDIIAEQEQVVAVDGKGDFSSPSVEVPLPNLEGAYAIEFSLQRKRFLQSLVSSSDPLTRRIDLVVFDHQAQPNHIEYWAPVATIQPLNSQWWNALNWFSTLGQSQPIMQLPTFSEHSKRLISHGTQETRKVGEQDCLVLGPNAWQAYPLTIEHPGQPHRIRIRVPRDRPQQLVVSVRDFHPTGDPVTMNIDSGIAIEDRQVVNQAIGAGLWADHEVVFWPRSPQPYLVMLNSSSMTESSYGELQLEVAKVGPFNRDAAQKPATPLAIAPASSPATRESTEGSRMVALYLSKPLLADAFGATRNVDPATRRPLDSWLAFHQAAQRLSQYMLNAGYNTLILNAIGEGGSIIPLSRLAATPRFDNGAFFSDGRSPETKDFVELLSCHFDRCGLNLILSMDLNCHLPALAKAASDPTKNNSLFQVNMDGKQWQSDSDQNTRSVLYNPLNDQVQTELDQIIREVSQRYALHSSFRGIAIELKEATHFSFAGDRWGYDDLNLQKFEAAIQSKLPPRDALANAMQGGLKLAYLNWRAKELSAFYLRLASTIRKSKADAKLLINPLSLWQHPLSQHAYSDPLATTRNLSDTLLAAGVDAAWLNQQPHVTVLRAQLDSPFADTLERNWQSRVSSDPSLQFLHAGSGAGSISLQTPSSVLIPEANKLRTTNTSTNAVRCYPTASAVGAEVRKQTIEALHNDDTLLIADGSWMPVQSDSMQLNLFRKAYTALPNAPMRTIKIDGGDSNFRLRSLKVGNDTYLQMINNASWAERVTMDVKIADIPGIYEVLGGRNLPIHGAATTENSSARGEADGKRASTVWQFDLPPYDMIAFKISDPQFKLNNLIHSADPSVLERMKSDLETLEAQLAQISDTARAESLGLRGGDFEQWIDGGRPLGWTLSSLPHTTISAENSLPRSGSTCVAIENKNQAKVSAWMQSEQINIPASGRVVVSAWVRSPSVGTQPQVMRLSLIGRLRDGRRYQRSHQFGAPSASGSAANAATGLSSAASPSASGNGNSSTGTQSNSEVAVDWGRRPITMYVTDLPSDELTELYVAFDLIGPGKVWIDDVQAFEAYLNPDERVQIRGQLFLAKEKLRENNAFAAEQVLNSPLARYIQNVMPVAPKLGEPQQVVAPEKASTNESWNGPQPVLKQLRQSMRERWQR